MFGTGFWTSTTAVPVQAKAPQPQFPAILQVQNQSRLPDLDGVARRFREATIEWTEWSQTDSWAKKYAGNKKKIAAETENRTLVEVLKTGTGEDFDEVDSLFVSPTPSRVLERQARLIKGFCGDATTLLVDHTSGDGDLSLNLSPSHDPGAWVSDWEQCPPEEAEGSNDSDKKYGRVLDRKELYKALQKKRFSTKGDQAEPGPPRRIYINKPDRGTILALIQTTSPSQVPGVQALLSSYITMEPVAVIRSREIVWWNSASFLFVFNLPFFVISTQDHQDTRTLFNGQRPLRRRHDLGFLHLGDSGQDYYDEDDFPTLPSLFEAVCSIMVTGRNERYWTAVCLNDDFNENTDDQWLPSEGDTQHIAGATDPITSQDEVHIGSPRAYALASLANVLAKVADYHKDIQDRFRTSLNHHTSTSWHGSPEKIPSDKMKEWRKRYPEVLYWVIHYNAGIIEKLKHFLAHHLMLTPEGLPEHPLWQSVHKEEKVSQYLTDIKDTLDSLCDIDSELRRFLIEARRESKSGYQDEQLSREQNLHKIAFAGLVLTILNLVAQIYAGRPDDISVLSSPGFMALTWISLVFGIICVVPFWGIAFPYLKELWGGTCKLVKQVRDILGEQGKCLVEFLCYIKYLLVAVGLSACLRRIGGLFRRRATRALRMRGRRTSPV